MTTTVKFELAKLLKEKGFDKNGYLQDVWLGNKYEWRGRGKNKKSVEVPVFGLGSSSVLPTIAEVCMWLYDKHGVWISVIPKNELLWKYDIYTTKVTATENIQVANHNSTTEAYEAGIEHTLNNLI